MRNSLFIGLKIVLLFSFLCYGDLSLRKDGFKQGSTGEFRLIIDNNTSSAKDITGIRFKSNDSNILSYVDKSKALVSQVTDGYEFKYLLPVKTPSGSSSNEVLNYWTTINGDATPYNEYYLVKSFSAGKPDEPDDADPISLEDLEDLVNNDPDFYNSDYRYDDVDSLGRLGGLYSGGFFDTWKGETQFQFPDDGRTFFVSNSSATVDIEKSSKGSPMLMMTLVMGQEYFNVDYQWQLALGAKETGFAVSTHADIWWTNTDGAFGAFEVEPGNGVTRAIAYPKFYPEYKASLESADAAQDFVYNQYTGKFDSLKAALPGIGVNDYDVGAGSFMADMCGWPSFDASTAHMVNSYVVSILAQAFIYDLMAEAKFICWKEVLADAKDRYVGSAVMAYIYNRGHNLDDAYFPFHVDSYQDLLNDLDASSKLPDGFGDYRKSIMAVAEALIEMSRASQTDKSIPIHDEGITLDDLHRMFFGDGGTVATQGTGGLLKHFEVDRQKVWDDLTSAFNICKGKAPSTQGEEKVSLRYDFISILRTVKKQFDTSRPAPGGNDYNMRLKSLDDPSGVFASSNTCSKEASDNTYPFAELDELVENSNSYEFTINTNDDIEVLDIKWTLKEDWSFWQEGSLESESGLEKTFKITVSKTDVTDIYGDATGTLWYMVTDIAGNSIVKEAIIKGAPLKSAAAVDTKGDGKADEVHVHIVEDALDGSDNPNSPDVFKYNWPTQSPLKDVSGNTYNSNVITFTPANDDGDGLGLVEVKYPSFENSSTKDIVDSIGPAVESATYKFGESNSDPCTLTVIVTEEIDEISDAAIDYLKINGSVISQNGIKKGSNSLTWIFILDPSVEVKKGDKLNLVHNTGIVDVSPQNNPPLDINQEVEINVITKSEKVELLSATFEDVDANGKMDKISFELNGPAVADSDIDDMIFKVTWLDENGDVDTIEISGGDLGDNMSYTLNSSLSIKDDLTYVSDESSYGKVVFIHKIINGESWDTATYSNIAVDKMAPVAVEANYFIYKSNNKADELIVTFSEDVSNIANSEPFAFNDGSYKLILDLEELNDNVVTFTKTSGNTPEENDSLNINFEANVKDKNGNEQDNENNKHVKLNIASAIGILNVSYHDLSSPRDGYIDAIKVLTDTEIEEGIFDSFVHKIKLNDDREFETLDVSDFVPYKDDENVGFLISVSQAEGVKKNTAVVDGDKFEITEDIKTSYGFIMTLSEDIKDSLAPVITEALLFPVEVTKENYQDLISDTLKVEFSERVDFDLMDVNPLNFKKLDNYSFDVDLEKEEEGEGNFVYYLIDYNSQKPKSGDSVQISTDGEVQDQKGIIQKIDNIYVPIKVAEVAFHWNIGVYPNPVKKNDGGQVSEKKKNLSEYLQISDDDIKKGTQAIVFDPLGPAPSSSDLQITVTIVDALGHPIVVDEEFSVSGDGEIWYFLWDSQNIKGREVGSAIYLAYIKISPDIYGTISEPLKLGVKQ